MDGTVNEALEMVKKDYPEINVAQSKYRYWLGANDKANKDLVWAVLNPSRFLVLDSLIEHNGLVTP